MTAEVLDDHRLRVNAARTALEDQSRAAASRIDDLQQAKEAVEDQRDELDSLWEESRLDEAIAQEEWEAKESEVHRLRRRLREFGDHEGANQVAEPEERPDNLALLIAKLPSIADGKIRFTGNPGDVDDVDDIDDLRQCVNTAWDAVLALADFLRARADGEATAGVHEYLTNTPAGYRALPARKHARGESGATKDQFGDERLLSVPTDVSPDGQVRMVAHFKLAQIGRKSPRMHYYDHKPSGTIYIGYIGVHLTTARS